MRIELITIGDELLLGFTIDTNAAHLARELAAAGVQVVRRASVGDDAADIAAAAGEALDRTGAVITTGGLGPTSDDLTKPAIAALFGREMAFDDAIWQGLRRLWAGRGWAGEPPEANRAQAMIPAGAEVIANRHGSAPGIWLADGRDRWVAMLPGVPREMRGMLADELLPRLRERAGSPRAAATRARRAPRWMRASRHCANGWATSRTASTTTISRPRSCSARESAATGSRWPRAARAGCSAPDSPRHRGRATSCSAG